MILNVKTPEELYSWMNSNLTYEGVHKGYLKSPEEVISSKKAHCWETTELERVVLKELGYECFCLYLESPGTIATHTTLIYEDKHSYFWFEWAWGKYQGIHRYSSFEEAVDAIRTSFLKEYKNYTHFTYSTSGKVISTDEIKTIEKLTKWKSIDRSFLGFSRIPSSKTNIEFYKRDYRNLSHVKVGKVFDGFLLVNRENNQFVAVLQCNMETKTIVSLEVSQVYRKRGIASKLLQASLIDYGVKYLSVNKANQSAIRLYENHGWKTIREDQSMLYMEHPLVTESHQKPIYSKW